MTHPHMSTQSCSWDSAVYCSIYRPYYPYLPLFSGAHQLTPETNPPVGGFRNESRLTRYKRSPEISPNCAAGGSGETFTFGSTKTWILYTVLGVTEVWILICFNQHHISWTELRISSKASTVFLEKMVENPYIVLCFLSENVGTTQIHCLHHHFPVERC